MRNEKQNSDRATTALSGLITFIAIIISAFMATVVAWSAIRLFTY